MEPPPFDGGMLLQNMPAPLFLIAKWNVMFFIASSVDLCIVAQPAHPLVFELKSAKARAMHVHS